MTRIYLGRDEWWPVPDPVIDEDAPDAVDIDYTILDQFLAARSAFMKAWNQIAVAAADAGDKYWQVNT